MKAPRLGPVALPTCRTPLLVESVKGGGSFRLPTPCPRKKVLEASVNWKATGLGVSMTSGLASEPTAPEIQGVKITIAGAAATRAVEHLVAGSRGVLH